MRKMKRFFAILLTASMLLSSETFSVLATEVETASSEVIETTEVAEVTETAEIVETTEAVENTENVEATEAIESTETAKETAESTEVAETQEADEFVEVVEDTNIEALGEKLAEEQAKGGYRPLPEEYDAPEVDYALLPMLFSGELESYYVTPKLPKIKNQYPYGTCWAFSSIALGEIALMQNGMETVDFSELHLAYFTYKSPLDPLGGTAGDVNDVASDVTESMFDLGGNLMFSSQALASWKGYADESKLPYSVENAELIEANGLSAEVAYDEVAHLKNAYLLDIKNNPELVKMMIKTYGGVGVSYYSHDVFYSPTYNSHYASGITGSNHAVVAVGWDDNFPKENFVTEAPGDGAWLIRNSWGSYGDEYNEYGYFWLSYYDSSLVETAYVFDVTIDGQDDYYDNNYQYDGGMYSGYYGVSNRIKAANVFTANGVEELKAVMFSTANVANQTYCVEVYTDLTDAVVPDSGTLAAKEEGACTVAGIYTIELSETVMLEEDETFAVIVTIYHAEGESYGYIDYERDYSYSGWFETSTSACVGQSLYYFNGAWKDFTTRVFQYSDGTVVGHGNFRIKAFTNNAIAVTGVEMVSGEVELGLGETATLVANVLPENAGNKKVTWSSADESIATVDGTGKVTAVNYGTATITATTADGGFTVSATVNVIKKLVGISFDKDVMTIQIDAEEDLYVSYNPSDTITDKTVAWSSSNEAVATVDSFVDDNGNGWARITAHSCGRAIITAQVADKTATCVISVPPTQTTVSAASNDDGSVTVTWEAVEDCTDYYIYRRAEDAETPTRLASVSAGTTSYTDTQAEDGIRYYYSVSTVYDDELGEAVETGSEEVYVVYKVLYVLGAGTNADTNPTTFCESTEEFVLAEPQYDEAIFEGWYLDSDYVNKVTAIDPAEYAGNITIYAKWRMRQEIQEDWLVYSEYQEYTGEAIVPEIKVQNGAYTLVEDTDYTMSYVNSEADGVKKCTVTITGIGEYKGTQTVVITEKSAPLHVEWISDITAQTYNGEAIEPEVVVIFKETVLEKEVDYTVSYENNVDAGIATVKVTGKGNFEATVEKNFVINPKVLEESFIADIEDYKYTGKAIEPALVVTDNGTELAECVDYNVSYSNNISVGTAIVTVTGCGNYSGSVQAEFIIRGESIETLIANGKLAVLFTNNSETYETVYTGRIIEPEVRLVLVDGGELVEGEEYSVSYENNFAPGTATVTVKGLGNYEGKVERNFEIRKAEIHASMISEIATAAFNGGATEPEITVTYNGIALVRGTDYIVTYENNLNIGTATVVVTGIGNFEGTVRKNFTIQTKSLKADYVSEITPPEYTGEAVEPNVVLSYNGVTLKKNVDYRISFSNNIEVGQATATIKGRGNYVGTIKVHFQIVGADLSRLEDEEDLTVLIAGSKEPYDTLYTGESSEPEVTLTRADGEMLVAGKDYEVSYSDNVAPGMATITIAGMGNYAGELTKTFEIRKHNIDDAVVAAGKTLTVLYTPAGQAPVPKVVYNNKRLVEGADFEVVYYLLDASGNRVNGSELKNVTDVGKYELVLKGKGTFTGTKELAATITVKARALDGGKVIVENPYARIDGVNITAQYQLLFGGKPLVEGTDYAVQMHVNENQEFVTYEFTGKGNYSGILTQRFKLIAADIIVFSEGSYKIAAIADQTYTGKRICPTISVVKADDETVCLTENVDYTVSYKHNLDAGTATVIVAGTGNCVGTMQSTFTIVPAGNVRVDFDEVLTYNAQVQKPEIMVGADAGTLVEGKDYTVKYLDAEGNSVESKAVGTYQIVVTMQGNYRGVSERTYEITALPVDKLQIVVPDMKYTGTAILPTMEDMVISLNGKELTEEEKAGLTIESGTDNVEVSDDATVIISGSGNFTGQVEQKFSIVEKPISDTDLTIRVGGEEVLTNATGYKTEWTGNPIEPSVEIWNGALKLVEGEDYTLTYRYNTEIGTARIIISGKGDYTGKRTLYFEITGMIFTEENGYVVSVAEEDCVYDGTKKQPEVTVTKDGNSLTKGTDYNVIYMNNVAAGTARVIVSGAGRYVGSITKEFVIAPKTLEDATTVNVSNIAKQRYSGERITPEITIEIDGVKLVEGKDYTKAVLNNVEVGIATVVATGIGNYAGVLAEKHFEIYYTTITYVMNGGVNSASNPTTYTAKDSFTLVDPEPRDAYNFAGWYSNAACTKPVYGVKAGTNGNLTFYAKWTPKEVYGLDVSKWQNQANSSGAINWNSVKSAGKTFAMIRLSYGTTLDPYFEYNYSGARSAGVKVGVYCYNTATTVEGAIAEANDVLSKLGGRPLDYPVCLDMEGNTVGALDNVTRTNIVFAFKNVVEAAGYDFILYANKNWLDNYFVDDRLAPLDLWIARYCDFNLGHRYTGPGNVRMWQYTDSGTVNGITGLVDLNICYEDYVKK